MASVRQLVAGRQLLAPARLGAGWSQLFGRSVLLVGSTGLARILGFGFTIVAARALGPAGFGLVTFTLTLANMASVALFNSPAGLAPALVRASGSERRLVLSSYLTVIGVLLLASLVAAIPLGLITGLRGAVLAGLLANLIGITALTVYREVLRGVDRYGAVAAYNVACNLVQLVAVAGLWFFGFTDPVLYITAFGLSSLAAIAVVAPWAHVSLRPSLRDVNRERVSAAARFVAPMLLQTVFFMLWLNADVIVLKALAGLAPVGEYGVAKSLANAALLIPSAIATALLPQAARIGNKDARGYFVSLLVPVCAASLLPLAGLGVLGPWVLSHVFGPAFAAASGALVVLALGMTLYGVAITLDASWTAMSRPSLVMLGTAASAFVTLVLVVPLVLAFGMIGAAEAVAAGAAIKLAILVVVSLRGRPAGHPQKELA